MSVFLRPLTHGLRFNRVFAQERDRVTKGQDFPRDQSKEYLTEGADYEKVLFISSNKMLGQGMSAAFQSKPEQEFLWAAQLHYSQAVVGVDIFHADVIILDIVDQEEMEQAVKICQSIRLDEQSVKILLLVRPEPAAVRKRAVDTKSAGLADDFVFYDSSLTYLLAKLEAL